jgi:hypothetical protein
LSVDEDSDPPDEPFEDEDVVEALLAASRLSLR